MKYINFFLCLLMVPIFSFGALDEKKIKIGGHRLCVPGHYVTEAGNSWNNWIYQIIGLDSEVNGFLFFLSENEIKLAIPDYKLRTEKYNADKQLTKVSGLAQFLSDENRELGRSLSGLSDIWLKKGAYKSRHIIFDPELELYKVYASSEPESRNIWHLFNQYPTENTPVPDLYSFAEGSCQVGGDDLSADMCDLKFIVLPHVEVRLSVSGKNLVHYQDLKDFIRGEFNRWKKECETN